MDHVISNANTVYGLDHVTNIMKFHSTYLETFLSLQEFIIYGEGPLPIQYRHYIAIMVNILQLFFVIRLIKVVSNLNNYLSKLKKEFSIDNILQLFAIILNISSFFEINILLMFIIF